MRQVPAFNTPPIGLAGDGRVARHFHRYFDLLGLPICVRSRRVCSASPLVALAYNHAPCFMAGYFYVLLWLKLFAELHDRFGIPASAASPSLTATAANILSDGGQALAGPFTRGDTDTIAAHLHAPEGDPFRAVHAAFARAYADHP